MDDSAPSNKNKPAASAGQSIEWAKVAVIPIVVALLGFIFTSYQKDRDAKENTYQKERDTQENNIRQERDVAENNVRLYTQLVSQREQSDSQLRTEMFKAVIEKFLSGGKSGDLRDMVLKLELLAYNFHESLDLGPLFKEVLRNLDLPRRLSPDERKELRKRLDAAAEKIIFQQVAALSVNGQRWSTGISPEGVREARDDSYVIDVQVSDPNASREGQARLNDATGGSKSPDGTGARLRLQVLAMDVNRREIKVRLLVLVQLKSDVRQVVDRHFYVSLYDFPMLDNTRLPNGQRCAVVLSDFFVEDKGSEEDKRLNSFANLEVVVFPATSASLKERIEYEELLRNMLRYTDKGASQSSEQAPR